MIGTYSILLQLTERFLLMHLFIVVTEMQASIIHESQLPKQELVYMHLNGYTLKYIV